MPIAQNKFCDFPGDSDITMKDVGNIYHWQAQEKAVKGNPRA